MPLLPLIRSAANGELDLMSIDAGGSYLNTPNWDIDALRNAPANATHLTLQHGALTPGVIRILAKGPRRESLALINIDLSNDTTLAMLPMLPVFDRLYIMDDNFFTPAVALTALNDACKQLHLRVDKLDRLPFLLELTQLTALHSTDVFSLSDLARVSNTASLKSLTYAPAHGADACHVLSTLALDTLGFNRGLLTETARIAIFQNPNIVSLSLRDMALHPQWLEGVLEMPALRSLKVIRPKRVLAESMETRRHAVRHIDDAFIRDFSTRALTKRQITVDFSVHPASV